MNRAERRRRGREEGSKSVIPIRQQPNDVANLDFSKLPVWMICQSVNLLLEELQRKNVHIFDFDDKSRTLRGIQIFGKKAYFLAERGSNEEI